MDAQACVVRILAAIYENNWEEAYDQGMNLRAMLKWHGKKPPHFVWDMVPISKRACAIPQDTTNAVRWAPYRPTRLAFGKFSFTSFAFQACDPNKPEGQWEFVVYDHNGMKIDGWKLAP